VGFAAGPPLGGWLGEIAGHGVNLFWPGIVAAALSVFATIGTLVLLRESLAPEYRRPFSAARASEPAVSSSWRSLNPRLVALLIASLAVGFGSSALQSVFPFWARSEFDLSLREIGLLFASMGAMAAVSQMLLIGPASHRFGERVVTSASLVAVVLALAVLPLAHGQFVLWFGILLFGLAIGLFFPASSSLATSEATPDRRGAVLGAINAAGTAGRIAGPALAGPLYFGFGSWTTFAAGGALTLVGLFAMRRGYAERIAAPAEAQG
jgi:MFS family permease